MRRSTVLAGFSVAVIAAVASGAFAGELTGEEKKWLRQCVDGLKSRSDRMQCGAESAMAALGLDAVPPLVPMLGALDPRDDADWEALTRALFGMGANSAAAALEKDRLTWPKTVAARIDVVVTDLRAGKLKRRGSKDAGAPANDDPAVEAKVIAALEYWETKSEFSSADPRLREITSLGRAAVPALLRYLQNGDHRHMSNRAAAQALEKVATEADVPAIAEALRAGALDAASALKRFRTPAARDALLDVVARGDMSHDVIEGLQPHARDPLVHRALTTWLRDRGATEEFNTGFVAAFLADNGVADALPEIEKLLDALGSARWQIGRAAALLGAKQGLRVLVEELESPSRVERGPGSSYERHSAGKALNDLTGRDWFTGTYDPFGKESNNAPAAAKRYREWWDSVKETVRFDAATKRWLDS